MAKITVQNTEITVLSHDDKDYISLTDMANGKQSESRAADIIKNWIRARYTIEFLGTWEIIHNPNFKVVEFDHFRMQAGLPNFVLSVSEWIEKTNAIGIIVKKGRYGGTYAFKDIAFEFGTAISVTFKLYLIEEFQRLKADEQKQLAWSAKRELSKINYRIHTDAIKSHLIPAEVTREQAAMKYAEEADVLNVAMFGMTARQWREANPDLKGNIRDYATINELICLSNMENINAVLINDGMQQSGKLRNRPLEVTVKKREPTMQKTDFQTLNDSFLCLEYQRHISIGIASMKLSRRPPKLWQIGHIVQHPSLAMM